VSKYKGLERVGLRAGQVEELEAHRRRRAVQRRFALDKGGIESN